MAPKFEAHWLTRSANSPDLQSAFSAEDETYVETFCKKREIKCLSQISDNQKNLVPEASICSVFFH